MLLYPGVTLKTLLQSVTFLCYHNLNLAAIGECQFGCAQGVNHKIKGDYADSFQAYKGLDKEFASHETVDHARMNTGVVKRISIPKRAISHN